MVETPKVKPKGSAPIVSFRAGALSVSVFENTATGKDGQEFKNYNVSLKRGYKDAKGEWQDTNQLRVNDLPKAVLLLNKVFEHLVTKTSSKESED